MWVVNFEFSLNEKMKYGIFVDIYLSKKLNRY